MGCDCVHLFAACSASTCDLVLALPTRRCRRYLPANETDIARAEALEEERDMKREVMSCGVPVVAEKMAE
jgi:hypothetical protein